MKRLQVVGVIFGCLSLVGCAGSVLDDGGGESEELRRNVTLYTSAAVDGVASVDFSAGSGGPYAGAAKLYGQLPTLLPQLGCFPTNEQLDSTSGNWISVGWDGGILDQGAIRRENYAKLAAGGTVTATVDRCDAAGTPREVGMWIEIRGSGSRLKFTTVAPDGTTSDAGGDLRACIQDSCDIFDYYFPTSAPGLWTLIVENTGNKTIDLAQVNLR